MKRLFALLLCLMILCCFAGCHLGKQNKDVVDENFYCKVIDGNNVAIGNLKTYPKSGAVFFPEKIENYTVSKLGFNSGLGFGGNGYFHMSDQNGTVIRRCYFPRSIKEIGSGYMYLTSGNLQIFYCGEIVDLNNFNADEKVKIYVPSEKYALFKEVLSEYFGGGLLKANVSYCLNYDGNNYYYIDYYECGEKIMYIPPEPQRDDYSFVGWFKEADCVNRWDFEVDALQITEEMQEIKLFAKWESVDK
jgi:hypothetical protein